jgi:hypothetical protein
MVDYYKALEKLSEASSTIQACNRIIENQQIMLEHQTQMIYCLKETIRVLEELKKVNETLRFIPNMN